MRHIEKALIAFKENNPERNFDSFIKIENTEDKRGVAPIIKFTIQSDPVSEVGVNGIQARDILEYTKHLFQSLNNVFPCKENNLTILKLEEALHWQDARTRDRERRKVEGQNKA